MKSYDKVIAGILMLLSLAGYFTARHFLNEPLNEKQLIIEIDGKEYARLDLEDDTQEEMYFDISQPGGQYNKVLIYDGGARMVEASCPDKLCIYQGWINTEGPLIVCLPNRVVLRIVGDEQ